MWLHKAPDWRHMSSIQLLQISLQSKIGLVEQKFKGNWEDGLRD